MTRALWRVGARQTMGWVILATPLACPFSVHAACPGDCNGDGQVSVAEVLTMVNMALGTGGACAEVSAGTAVDIALILQAVNSALNGCPSPTLTASGTDPGADDCCQCPDFCAAPADGTCGGCAVVVGAACVGGSVCTQRTPTPTTTPTRTQTAAKTPTATITPENANCLTDNGDGTISDGCTGLMWENKDQAGGLHDYGAVYPWVGQCDVNNALCQPDAIAATACAAATHGALGCSECVGGACVLNPGPFGTPSTTIWGWLAQLNQGEGFAGHNDWRIPTVGKEGDAPEWETILSVPPVFDTNCPMGSHCDPNNPNDQCGAGQSCVASAGVPLGTCRSTPGCTVTSCSCTWDSYYWSATSDVSTPNTPPRFAWFVDFTSASVISDGKELSEYVRAVRGGSITPTPTATPTATGTPGANDCCQCPSSCAAPVDGTCGGCSLVAGATCDGDLLCVFATPTATPTGCVQRDNGDGTITDGCTGLMWEKKDQAGGLHDYSTAYAWAGRCADDATRCQPNAAAAAACAAQTDGEVGCSQCARGTCIVDSDSGVGTNPGPRTTIWDWLSQLNAASFAGHGDWRIPTLGQGRRHAGVGDDPSGAVPQLHEQSLRTASVRRQLHARLHGDELQLYPVQRLLVRYQRGRLG